MQNIEVLVTAPISGFLASVLGFFRDTLYVSHVDIVCQNIIIIIIIIIIIFYSPAQHKTNKDNNG